MKIQTYFDDKLTTYYLIFSETTTGWRYLLKTGFGHITVVTHDAYNWIELNPRHLWLNVEILPVKRSQPGYLSVSKPSDTILQVKMHRRDNIVKFGSFGMRTCVTLVKYMLGLKIKSQTPYRLYTRLLRMCTRKRNMLGIHSIKKIQ